MSNKDKAVDINYVQEKYTLTDTEEKTSERQKSLKIDKVGRHTHTNTHLLWSGNEIEFTLTSFYYNLSRTYFKIVMHRPLRLLK